MAHLQALILAAGLGRRFGGAKLHALYRGRPLLSYVLDVVVTAIQRGLIDAGHVVVRADDDLALSLSHSAGLGTILNDAPELGLSHSVRLGLTTLQALSADQAGAALIFLGDQPLVRLEVVDALVARWRGGSMGIVRPRYQARPDAPGHPALVARSVWPFANRLQGDRGLGSLLDSTRLDAATVNVPGDNPDIDTTADLHTLEEASQ